MYKKYSTCWWYNLITTRAFQISWATWDETQEASLNAYTLINKPFFFGEASETYSVSFVKWVPNVGYIQWTYRT